MPPSRPETLTWSPFYDKSERDYAICLSESQKRGGRTHWQGHQDQSKSVPIFVRGTEANLKMVSINSVSIPG